MRRPRILIVSYNWPPRNAIGTHRPYSWAKYWSQWGADITVLTARKYGFDKPLDLHLPILNGVKVIEVAYKTGFGGRFGILWATPIRKFAKRAKACIQRQFRMSLDPRAGWREAARSVALGLCSDLDVVVSSFGPSAAHFLANDMKSAHPSLFWVADYRDLWSQNHSNEMSDALRAATRKQELESVGARADLLVSVSSDLARQLAELTGKQTLKITNGFDQNKECVGNVLSQQPKRTRGVFRIVYTGTIYERFQDLKPLLDSLVKLSSADVRCRGNVTVDVYGAGVDAAKRLANISAYAPFIRLMGHVSREKALEAQRSAGLLLLLENSAPAARGVLTGKLFEYLVAGKPILCLGSLPDYEIGQILSETGTGQVVGPDQYGGLASLLKETLDGAGMFDSFRPNLQAILQYTRENQAGLLLRGIHYHLAERGTANSLGDLTPVRLNEVSFCLSYSR